LTEKASEGAILQQSMELLVVTLAHSIANRDTEVFARIRSIGDTLRSAPGLVAARYFRSRTNDTYYFILTTWQDEESWQQAQERHNPKQLLLATSDLLSSPPEQWLMSYIWGYSRPIAPPTLTNAHIIAVRPQHIELVQKAWLQNLRQYNLQVSLAFAFFARGSSDIHKGEGKEASHQQGSTLLCLFSWASDVERQAFYVDANYLAMNKYIEGIGNMRILLLEPVT